MTNNLSFIEVRFEWVKRIEKKLRENRPLFLLVCFDRESGTGYAMFNREGVEDLIIREFKPHVHSKRQKSDSS